MNHAGKARARLGLTEDEFALLLAVPVGIVRAWENSAEERFDAPRALFTLIRALPWQSAEVLIEERITSGNHTLGEAKALAELARRLHSCQII
jgi:hypothetical protein